MESSSFDLREVHIIAELSDSKEDCLIELVHSEMSQVCRPFIAFLKLIVYFLVLFWVAEIRVPVSLVERRHKELVYVGG